MSVEPLFDDGANRYDALLVVSFGGPEGMADVMPFLDNVLEGLSLPDAARRRVAARYERFGGVSPINAHTRALIAALRETGECGDEDSRRGARQLAQALQVLPGLPLVVGRTQQVGGMIGHHYGKRR